MITHAKAWQGDPPAFRQVDIQTVGTVSLATLDEVREAKRAEQAKGDHLTARAAELEEHAEDRLAEAGALLVPRRAWWEAPAELSSTLSEAERLVAHISRLDERIALMSQPEGGLVSRIIEWWRHALGWDRARAAMRLRRALVMIARAGAAAAPWVPEVKPLLDEAAELHARAEGLHATVASVRSRLDTLDQEVRMREEAQRRMGFDSLHLAAYYLTNGMPAIPSPIELPAGEVAYLAVDAQLARMPVATRQARTSAGSGVSAAHTGLRHWVGAFRNRAAPAKDLHQVDTGILVISSLRLMFIGSNESFAIALGAVFDMTIYDDGLAVFHLSREGSDLFLVTAPMYVAFCVNWAMSIRLPGWH